MTRRVCLSVLLAAASFLNAGCCLFTASLREVGRGREKPVTVTEGDLPAVQAWRSADQQVLYVQYESLAGDEKKERWLRIDAKEIAEQLEADRGQHQRRVQEYPWENGPNTVVLNQKFIKAAVAHKPDLETLQSLPVVSFIEWTKAGRSGDAGLYCTEGANGLGTWMQIPGKDKPAEVRFSLPEREYRTAGGCAAQALLPGAVALDVATSPIQGLVIACFALAWCCP
jgi:hypothetical protein